MLGGKNLGTSEACAGCRMNEEDFQYRVNEKMALKGGPDFMCRDHPKFTCKKKTFKGRNLQHWSVKEQRQLSPL